MQSADPSSSSAPTAPATTPATTPQSLLDRIRDPASSPDERFDALRSIKNDVIGTLPSKETWVRRGALEAIMTVLQSGPHRQQYSQASDLGMGIGFGASSSTTTTGGLGTRGAETGSTGANGDGGSRVNAETLTKEESARSEALRTLASLVKGGPSFLAPTHAVGALPVVLAHLSPTAYHPQVVLAALCVVDNLAAAADLAFPAGAITPDDLASQLFTPPHRDYLQDILSSWLTRDPNGRLSQICLQQVNLVTKLIATLCRREEHQLELADDILLDHLASLAVSIAVAQGHAWHGVIPDQKPDNLPQPAPRNLKTASLMDAISAVIVGSNYRVCKFLWSPAFIAILSDQQGCPAHPEGAHWSALEKNEIAPRDQQRGRLDCLMPAIHYLPRTSSPLSFKRSLWGMSGFQLSLKAFDSGVHWDGKESGQKLGGDDDSDRIDHQAVPWLVHQMRLQRSHVDKLAIAHVIACVTRSRTVKISREMQMCSMLVVPPVLEILRSCDVADLMANSSPESNRDADAWYVLRRAPTVIAKLAVIDSSSMDKAMHDGDALKLIAKMFNKTHTTAYRADKPVWWSPDENQLGRLELPGPRTLGEDGVTQINLDIAQVRESALWALMALCIGKEETRQLASKEGVIPHIVDSLNLGLQSRSDGAGVRQGASDKASQVPESEPQLSSVQYGRVTNPVPVLIAACNAIRILSRSTAHLRTAMVDCDVFTPIFKLLSHPDVDVQEAASAAMNNLVVRMSSGREKLIEMGIADVLCKLARSSHPKLRFNALWGIKHLIDNTDLEIKRSILKQLTPEWLLQGIIGEYDGGDSDDGTGSSSRVRDRLDIGSLLSRDQDDDVDMGQDTPKGPEPTIHERLAVRLEEHWKAEANPTATAYRFDVLVQEQFIDVVRNMVVPSESYPPNTVMIDMLFGSIGSAKWFEALMGKLQMRPIRPASGPPTRSSHRHIKTPSLQRPSPPPPRVTYPRAITMQAVIYVLVNLAASGPQYRDLVLQQTRLLELVSHQGANCTDNDVRRAVCHLVNNLIDEAAHDDKAAREARITELKRLGISSRLEVLRDSSDKDVQQLAKGALDNMDWFT